MRKDFSLAESEGFEPPVPVKAQQFSRLSQSTTLPTLRRKTITFWNYQKDKMHGSQDFYRSHLQLQHLLET